MCRKGRCTAANHCSAKASVSIWAAGTARPSRVLAGGTTAVLSLLRAAILTLLVLVVLLLMAAAVLLLLWVATVLALLVLRGLW